MHGDDSLQGLARIQREVAELAQGMPAEDPDARYEGRDATRTVRAEIDAEGVVHDLHIDRAWRRRLGSEQLAAAIQEAVHDATATRLAAWGEAIGRPAPGRSADRPGITGEEFTNTLNAIAGHMDPADSDQVFNQLLTMLEQMEASIDGTIEQIEQQVNLSHAGRTRHVSVSITGANEIVSVECDVRWLETAHELNIAREVRDAMREAYQRAQRHSVKELIEKTEVGRLRKLAADPFALSRQFGIRS